MKKFLPTCLLLGALTTLQKNAEAQNWQLVWQDEFTNGISSDWVFETGNGSGGWGNNELEYYRAENATVENGQLVITAKNESYGGYNYTSARMKTQGKKSWKFGKIEARIKMPAFSGIWPAFWMLGDNISSVGWPSCGELDIMEHINSENINYGTAHWSDPNGQHASYGGNTGVTVTDYHVYSIEWDTNYIRWFVDGVKYHEIYIGGGINGTSEFQNNFFILLNMAVGGNWPGFNIDNGGFPAKMYVDYVRVYQDGGGSVTGPVVVYQDCNYGGTAVALNPGSYTLSQLQALGVANDWVSSIKVQSGYKATLYWDDNYSGSTLVKTADDACLVDDGWNDKVSSIVIGSNTASSTLIQAESYSNMSGVQTEATTDDGGGLNVGYIDAGDWMAYPAVNFPTSGSYLIEYRVASLSGGGRLSTDLNAGSIVLGQLDVPSTGGWQNWTTISHTVNVTAGTYNPGIYAVAGGWNLNWIRITPLSTAKSAATTGMVNSLIDNSVQAGKAFTIYPNPVKQLLNISSGESLAGGLIRIYDISGKQVISARPASNHIDVSALAPGVYTLLFSKDKTRITKEFVK
ncbi:carbohydrate-binding protein [Niastella vici]|uniref:Carbohydrate-binding protein n=1 Tax=Niastella vici TaxID=1703345 RepID=A0A1V9FTS7_9BACT|nr:carbohydrate-binding protein [Niastella vici]OQP61755.1 carbohydrate-binding protein [Niastella vici]